MKVEIPKVGPGVAKNLGTLPLALTPPARVV